MAETPNPESGTEQTSTELPIPKLESASSGSSPSSVDTEALTEAILKRLEPVLDKKLQSTKDKRIANIEKQLGMKDLSELEDAGVQIPDSVKLEYRLRQLENGRQDPEPSSQAPTSQGSGATLTAQDVSEAVKQFNLDANNADVIEALRGTYRNRDHFEATLAKLAISKTNKPTPSAADSTTLASTGTARPDDVKAITDEYEARLAKIPRGNTMAVSKLKAEIRKKAREKGFYINL